MVADVQHRLIAHIGQIRRHHGLGRRGQLDAPVYQSFKGSVVQRDNVLGVDRDGDGAVGIRDFNGFGRLFSKSDLMNRESGEHQSKDRHQGDDS